MKSETVLKVKRWETKLYIYIVVAKHLCININSEVAVF